MMLLSLHNLLAVVVIAGAAAVGLWALLAARRREAAATSLTAGALVVCGVLVLQVLLGMALVYGARLPGTSLRLLVHAGAPVVALIVALGLVAGGGRRTARTHALAMLAIVGAALVSLAVRVLVPIPVG
jgi:hypothetical protein